MIVIVMITIKIMIVIIHDSDNTTKNNTYLDLPVWVQINVPLQGVNGFHPLGCKEGTPTARWLAPL